MSTIHTDLQNGVTYYYSAASYDNQGNFQSTAYVSAMPTAPSNGSHAEYPSSGGGCGMIDPRKGNPPGPSQEADILGLVGAMLLIMVKRVSKRLKGTIIPA